MAVHNFAVDFSMTPRAKQPAPPPYPQALQQAGHASVSAVGDNVAGRTPFAEIGPTVGIAKSDTEDFVMAGFEALDASMKMFWSDMRIPTKDSYRLLRVKLAGMDKSVAVWRDDLLNGRAQLPVASLNRTKEQFLKERFSPAYWPMAVRYPGGRGNLAALVYRPTPWMVSYSLTVFSEHKRDNEHAKYQILTRFNPLASFLMTDGHLRGVVTLHLTGSSDQSDKETSPEQRRRIKYEYTIDAEAWLPLPERVIPAILGIVGTIRDFKSPRHEVYGRFGGREMFLGNP